MMIVKLDKDNISETEVRKLKEKIQKEQNCQVILYRTKNGYHLELLFDNDVDSFKIRKKYGDCSERLRISSLKCRKICGETDILFTIKNGYQRERMW
jgi:hypothetical protein